MLVLCQLTQTHVSHSCVRVSLQKQISGQVGTLQLCEEQHSWVWVSGWIVEVVLAKVIQPERKIKCIHV